MREFPCSNGANPDIGGIGVMSSAFTQVSIVCLVAWALYFATGDFHIILGAVKRTRTRIRANRDPTRRTLRRYLSIPSVFLSSFATTQKDYSTPIAPALIDTRHVLRVQLLQEFTLSLSDLQTFAGISYFVAVFSQMSSIKQMDMYHMSVIQSISWLTPTSHVQALRYAFVPGLEGLTVRMVAISVFCALFLAFEGVYLTQLMQMKTTGYWCNSQGDDSMPWVIADTLFVVWTYWPFLVVLRNHRRHRSRKEDDVDAGPDSLVVEQPQTPRSWGGAFGAAAWDGGGKPRWEGVGCEDI